jgi:hypothetical protein
VATFSIPQGSYAIHGWVDLTGNPDTTQYQCTLKLVGDGTIDTATVNGGVKTRLLLGGTAYMPNVSTGVTLVCGSDGASKVKGAHFNFVTLDHLTPAVNVLAISN